jgi:hypothetical protein
MEGSKCCPNASAAFSVLGSPLRSAHDLKPALSEATKWQLRGFADLCVCQGILSASAIIAQVNPPQRLFGRIPCGRYLYHCAAAHMNASCIMLK